MQNHSIFTLCATVVGAFVVGCSGQATTQDPAGTQASPLATSAPAASDGAKDHKHGHKPPQQAFDACASKASGDACSMTFGSHNVSGKCGGPRHGGDANAPLACHPDHHGPPPEAFTACDGKAAGDACNVQFGDKAMAGACVTPRHGNETRLLCAPPHHDHDHDHE